jgi:hypothetical protein
MEMILVYLLFALTVSAILIALFSEHIPQNRKGELYIGIFVALMVLTWAADTWLFPALAAGPRTSWPLVATLIIFAAILAVSLSLSVRTPGPLRKAVANRSPRIDTEAEVFDLLLWSALFVAGIIILRSIRF